MEATLELQLLAPDNWQVLRDTRLAALRDSPHAFMSTHAEESAWQEAQWRQAFDASTWIVAREDDQVIGLARSVSEPGRPWARHVESIWVAPTHRRRGVFRDLLWALARIEGDRGVTDLQLWVLEDNDEAQRAYEALGFVPTGECQPVPDFGRFERRLRLAL
jgi:ribosomal protein S18 acetylase RimI-like enzyme